MYLLCRSNSDSKITRGDEAAFLPPEPFLNMETALSSSETLFQDVSGSAIKTDQEIGLASGSRERAWASSYLRPGRG